MWLPWHAAIVLCVVVAAVAAWLRGFGHRRVAVVHAFARETAIILALYTLWQVAGTLSVMHLDGAIGRGQSLWRLEHRLRLPSELTMQRELLPHSLLVQACNAYYAIVHVPALGVFLAWLFVRHRRDYPLVRNTIAVLTMTCLLIQLIPVAPPRLLPSLGFVDTGRLYHQSVYTSLGGGAADQLSAMPSVHVGWAVAIGVGAVLLSTSRWRWLALLHPAITAYVVAVTGNHFWLDGVVAVAVLVVAYVTLRRAHAVTASLRLRRGGRPALAGGRSEIDGDWGGGRV
jgi:hypothetical protein